MGIQGLIPFLEKTSRPINISEFSGCTVAIDAYCWLHKGAFSCAEKLARGEKCDAYVYYCMKYIHMLLSHNIKPIMVFDGQHLPAKADTEKKRRENRELNRRRAAELLRQDKPNEARSFIRRCVDITHNMALELMHACRAANVDCVTAPYEADAQLAYLNLTGVAHLVITEDSDLILFGCKKVVFKLDPNGGGLLVDQDKLHLSMKCRPENYSFEKFRRMCILSGCDYLPSLPGIGLSKACRFITRTMDPDIERALPRMSSYLNMPQLVVTKEYIENFVHAEAMFKHQPVFDTMQRKVMPLTPIDDSTPKLRLPQPLPEDEAYQLALGNLDPFTLKVVADWNPDQRQDVKKKWGTNKQSNHPSIWEVNFQITEPKFRPVKAKPPPSTAGKQIIQDPKIEFETSNLIDDKDFENILFDEEMNTVTQPAKKVCLSKESEAVGVDNGMEVEGEEDESRKSPILLAKINAKSKFFNKLKKQRNTVVDEKVKVQSRYFNSSSPILRTSASSANSTPVGSDKDTLKDISNVDELTRRSSPKKFDENILTTQISPTRKSRETPLSPGKRVVTVSSSLFTELSMEDNEVKDVKSCGKAASPGKLTKKSVTIRSSLFTEHSMEESKVKDTDTDKDNDSGVSCPNSFELDNVEECSQSSAKSVSSISTFTWKQKFHEKFGFKSNSGAEKVLQSSKAVNSGFQSPFSRKNADNSVNTPQTPSRNGTDDQSPASNKPDPRTPKTPLRVSSGFQTPASSQTEDEVERLETPLKENDDSAKQTTPAPISRRSNPFKMNSSQKSAMNSTPKFNLLRDSITDFGEMDQEIKDQISILSTPAKPKLSTGGLETSNGRQEKVSMGSHSSEKSPSKSLKSDKSPFGSHKLDKSPFGIGKPEKSPFGSSDKTPFGSGKSERSPFGNNKPDKSPFGSASKTSGGQKQGSSVKGKCRSVGLGKKSTTPSSSGNSSQRSLLSMFTLQPKPKLECK